MNAEKESLVHRASRNSGQSESNVRKTSDTTIEIVKSRLMKMNLFIHGNLLICKQNLECLKISLHIIYIYPIHR